MLKNLASIAFILLLITLSWANDDAEKFKIDFPVQEFALDNGLKIFTLEDHSAPVVCFQIWVHTGSKNERPGITGISHLFEHMMFKGSKKYGPEEHANIVQNNGGNLNAYTTEDATVYFENIPPDKLELVISLEAERFANLNLNDETLASERQVVKEERRFRVDDDPYGKASEQLIAAAYTAHPYHWPIVGWMSDLESLTLEDCKNYYRINYAPNNCTAVLVGDFITKDAINLVEKYFGKIPPQELPRKVMTVEPPQTGEKVVYLKRQVNLPIFYAGYHIPEMKNDDLYPLKVLQKIMSDGRSSRLYKKLVYEAQIAQYAGGFVDELEDPGFFYLFLGINLGCDLDSAKAMLFTEIERFGKEPVTDDELQKAKNQLEANFVNGLQTNSHKASIIGNYQVRTGDYRNFLQAPDKFQAVTKDDIMRVAGKYLIADNRTSVIVLPENNQSQ
jgi:predicted Zn-dependent peptidase